MTRTTWSSNEGVAVQVRLPEAADLLRDVIVSVALHGYPNASVRVADRASTKPRVEMHVSLC